MQVHQVDIAGLKHKRIADLLEKRKNKKGIDGSAIESCSSSSRRSHSSYDNRWDLNESVFCKQNLDGCNSEKEE